MATKIRIDQFTQAYQRLCKIEFDKVKPNEKATENTNELLTILGSIKDRYDKVDNVKYELGDLILNQAFSTLNTFLTQFERNLPPINANPTSAIANLDSQIRNYYEQTFNWWPQVLSILNSRITTSEITDIVNENRKLTSEIKKQKELSESEVKLIEDLRLNVESKLNLLETRYSSNIDAAELNTQKNLFEIAAGKNRKNSTLWLVFIIISMLLTSWVFYEIMLGFCFDMNCLTIEETAKYKTVCENCPQYMLVYEIFKGALFRILIISILLFIIRFGVKNYNAQMHQQSINLHKMNSFDVALAFITKSTEAGKDKIMTLAAQTIFAQYKTGYGDKDGAEEIKPTIVEKIIDKASDKI